MRRTTIVAALAAAIIALAGCSASADEKAQDCAAALSERTGGDSKDTPTVGEAKERVDAFDKTLAGMVRSGYQSQADRAFNTLGTKAKEGGEERPEACGPLSDDDYTALQMATAINSLGWTKDGEFDKLQMVEHLDG
ncbi:hypothetical protein [Streptomyces sp. NPDC001914]|uniref:hypothetical protein n=1 Tax=Streptomyces sp. NPDC001914 TaxID=3364623 RepID=UPI0036A8C54E